MCHLAGAPSRHRRHRPEPETETSQSAADESPGIRDGRRLSCVGRPHRTQLGKRLRDRGCINRCRFCVGANSQR